MSFTNTNFLRPAIDHYLLNKVDDQDRKTHCFHPSSLTECPRVLYDLYVAESLESSGIDPRTKRIFDNGHGVHFRLQDYCKEVGILIDQNVNVSDDKYEICGEIDGLLEFCDELIVLDIKSINNKNFLNLYFPPESHVVQVNIYLYCLGLKYGILLYECKDNQELAEFGIEYDPKVLVPIFKKIRYVQDCVREKRIPPREIGYKCEWCKKDKDCA